MTPEEKQAHFNKMMAEVLGRSGGYCKGKGGSMHIADPESGNLGANAIVGGSAGIATGSRNVEAAKALIRFLASAAVAPAITRTGLEPVAVR